MRIASKYQHIRESIVKFISAHQLVLKAQYLKRGDRAVEARARRKNERLSTMFRTWVKVMWWYIDCTAKSLSNGVFTSASSRNFRAALCQCISPGFFRLWKDVRKRRKNEDIPKEMEDFYTQCTELKTLYLLSRTAVRKCHKNLKSTSFRYAASKSTQIRGKIKEWRIWTMILFMS